MSEITKSNRLKGIFFIILSAFGFAVMSAFIKLSGDLPNIQKVFFRNLVSAIIALFLIIKHKGSFTGKKENRKILIYRSLFGTIGIIFNYYAIDNLVLSDANMLNKISPFLVVVFCALILKEKINLKQILAIIVAFIGALFIVKPSFDIRVVPYIIGFLSAVFAALAYTCVRMLGNKEEYYTIVFFFSTFSMLACVPYLIVDFHPISTQQMIFLLLTGLAAAGGQFGITAAYTYAPAREISVYDYTQIMFSAVLGFLFFGQLPDLLSFIGYCVIVAAGVIMFLYNKRRGGN